MRKTIVIVVLLVLLSLTVNVHGSEEQRLLRHNSFISDSYGTNDFKLAFHGVVADLYVEINEFPGVARALGDLGDDINRVTTLEPVLKTSVKELGKETVIVGTIGQSQIINELIKAGKLDVDGITGKWESYVIQVINDPVPGVNIGLVIAGSDRRGTIYGIYELSRQIGVSPWYWWADVVPVRQDDLVVKSGVYKQGEPSVKYRGIFLNNEAPSLSTWVSRFGGFNHQFYEHVFELILRLRANYLWPAMWSPKSFFRDDHLTPYLADQYGIVVSTSHHEPMMRAWGEWGRYGSGEWNYSTNKTNLLNFWQEGIQWSKNYEKIVTVGMRGDGDEPMMHSGSLQEMIAIMESIIGDQRQILSHTINQDVTKIPQVWALYKEVQELYENGMEVPEDITILLANDNFGNIRMLPKEAERNRLGGFGMYYHFDYVGGPRSYRWVNSTPNHKIWEQMSMAYDYGVDRIWIVNVGDLKPHEIATEFFLEMAYDISKWHKDNLNDFSFQWAEREFGPDYASDVAEITDRYRQFTGRRKSEIVEPETYSLINYKEAERVLAEFEEIVIRAEEIYQVLPENKKDAFFQLVLYPARASKNVLKINIYAGLNNLYAEQGAVIANIYADLVEQAFRDEALDTQYYHTALSDGKWRGIMSNAHIGQKDWQTPERNIMPKIQRLPLIAGAEMGIAIEGSRNVWTDAGTIVAEFPTFSILNKQEKHYIDVLNMKADTFVATITPSEPWIVVNKELDVVDKWSRIWVEIDWDKTPIDENLIGELTIRGADKTMTVQVIAYNPNQNVFHDLDEMTFFESNGYISIEAEHYKSTVPVNGVSWQEIKGYGRTLSSMTVFPTTSSVAVPPANSPYLEYQVHITNPGSATVTVYTAPTNNINRERGLSYGISFDNEEPKIVDTFPKENDAFYTSPLWSQGVMDNIRTTSTRHQLDAGLHTLKFWMVDPGVVLQKIVINTGGVRPSYLGPPESYFIGKETNPGKEGYLQLLTAFDYANYLIKNTKVGENHGQTRVEDLNTLYAKLLPAQAVLGNRQASLQKRLNMLEQVKIAIKHFESELVYKKGYEALQELIVEAQTFLANVRIGDKHEEYPFEAKESLQAVIRSGLLLLDNTVTTKEQRLGMLGILNDQLEKFKASMVINPHHRLIQPIADAFVRDGSYAGNNHGNIPNLEVKWEADREGMTRVAFLKFDISNFTAIEEAILRLYVEFSDQLETRVIGFYDVTEVEWSEDTLTWENALLIGGTLIKDLNVSNESDVWCEVDLTKIVERKIFEGSNEITIRIENKSDHWGGLVRFTSKEGANPPELKIIEVP